MLRPPTATAVAVADVAKGTPPVLEAPDEAAAAAAAMASAKAAFDRLGFDEDSSAVSRVAAVATLLEGWRVACAAAEDETPPEAAVAVEAVAVVVVAVDAGEAARWLWGW